MTQKQLCRMFVLAILLGACVCNAALAQMKEKIPAHLPKDVIDGFVRLIPRGTMGRPEEIATAALFLASSDSSFVTGSELCVDGGVAQI